MINFLDKFIKRTNNLDYVAKSIKDLSKDTPIKKVFDSINSFSISSEIRYVGGCIRNIIQKEIVDDIDLATNLNPHQVCEALKNKKIIHFLGDSKNVSVSLIKNCLQSFIKNKKLLQLLLKKTHQYYTGKNNFIFLQKKLNFITKKIYK